MVSRVILARSVFCDVPLDGYLRSLPFLVCDLTPFRVGLTWLSSKMVSHVVLACSVFDDVALDGSLVLSLVLCAFLGFFVPV